MMNEFLLYLLKVNCCFSILYLAFYLFFRKLTFHKMNRIILLAIIPISCLIPLLQLSSQYVAPIQMEVLRSPVLVALAEGNTYQVVPDSAISIDLNFWDTWEWIYGIGVIYHALHIFLSIFHIYEIKRSSFVLEQGNGRLFVADIPSIFSYFHWIFIPKDRVEAYEVPIIEHERAHARYGHTWDLIFAELFASMCWFNPFAYGYKKSLRSIHEFQADKAVLNMNVKKSLYLSLLLNEITSNHTMKFYSYFHSPTIKQRVDMMTASSSNKKSMLSYVLFLPVLAILFMGFVKPSIERITHIESAPLSTTSEPPLFIFPVPDRTKNDITFGHGKKAKHPVTEKIITHGGIDIRASKGTNIVATAAGVVASASFHDDWGNLVVITHTDGYESWYAHMEDMSVQKNQTVEQGDIIGHVGSTGLSKGPHLHFEIRLNEERLDPLDFIQN